MKWFGDPWPTDELRASVCESDLDRVPLPPGEICPMCGNQLEPDDRGVVIPHMAASDIMPGMFITEIRYHHLGCIINSIGVGLS